MIYKSHPVSASYFKRRSRRTDGRADGTWDRYGDVGSRTTKYLVSGPEAVNNQLYPHIPPPNKIALTFRSIKIVQLFDVLCVNRLS